MQDDGSEEGEAERDGDEGEEMNDGEDDLVLDRFPGKLRLHESF